MKLELIKWVVCLGIIAALCTAFYFLGRSHAEVKIIKEKGEEIVREVEVIKYVEKQKSEIWSAPNATSSELLGLMQNNQL